MASTVERAYYSSKLDETFVVFRDIDVDNPMETGELLTQFICFHKKHKLGNEHEYNSEDFESWDELEEHIKENEHPLIIKKLSLYDHSGIRLHIGSPQDRWDSGYVGFAIITEKKIEEWGIDHINLDFEAQVERDVRQYDHYLNDEVFSWAILKEKKCECCKMYKYETVDSGRGYVGYMDDCGVLDEVPEGFEEVSVASIPREVYELRDFEF